MFVWQLHSISCLLTMSILFAQLIVPYLAPKVSKGRRLASGDKEKAERVSRNERPLAATIEAADAPAGAKPLLTAKQSF